MLANGVGGEEAVMSGEIRPVEKEGLRGRLDQQKKTARKRLVMCIA